LALFIRTAASSYAGYGTMDMVQSDDESGRGNYFRPCTNITGYMEEN
jgi:hypothetical protein